MVCFLRTKFRCLLMSISLHVIYGSIKPDEAKYVSSINVPSNIESVLWLEPEGYKEVHHNSELQVEDNLERHERDLADYGDYQFDRDLPDLRNAELHLFSWWKGADGKKINVTTSSHLKLNPTNRFLGPGGPPETTTQISNASLPTNSTTVASANVTSTKVNVNVTSTSSVTNASTSAAAASTSATTVASTTGSTYLTTCYTVTDTCLPLQTLVAAPICTQESTSTTENVTAANATQGSINDTTPSVTGATEAAPANTLTSVVENTTTANTGSPVGTSPTTPALVQFAQQAIPNPFSMVSGSMVIPVYRIPLATKIILVNTPAILEASTVAIENPVTQKFENNLKDVQLTESNNADEIDLVNKKLQHDNNINEQWPFTEQNDIKHLDNIESTLSGDALLSNELITIEPHETLNNNFPAETNKNKHLLRNIEQNENIIKKQNGTESHDYLLSQDHVLNKTKNELTQNINSHSPVFQSQKNGVSPLQISKLDQIIYNSHQLRSNTESNVDVTKIHDQPEPIVVQVEYNLPQIPKNNYIGRDIEEKHKYYSKECSPIKTDNKKQLLTKLKSIENSFHDKQRGIIQKFSDKKENNKYDQNSLQFNKDRNFSWKNQKSNFEIPLHQNSSSIAFDKTVNSQEKSNESFEAMNLYHKQLLPNDESLTKENHSLLISKKPIIPQVTVDGTETAMKQSFKELSNNVNKNIIKTNTNKENSLSAGAVQNNSIIISCDSDISQQVHLQKQLQKFGITHNSINSQIMAVSVKPINSLQMPQQTKKTEENSRQINRLSTNENIYTNLIKNNVSYISTNSVDSFTFQPNKPNNIAKTNLGQSNNFKFMKDERHDLPSNNSLHDGKSVNVYFKYNDTFLARQSSNDKNLIDICKNVTCKGNDYLAQCCGQKICPPDKCKGEDFSYLHPIPGDTTTTSIRPCCKENVNRKLEKPNLYGISQPKTLFNFSNIRVIRENGMNDFVKFQLMHGITAPDGKDLLNALKEAKIQMQKVSQEFHPESEIKNVQTVNHIPFVQQQLISKQHSEDKPPFIDTNKILENLRATMTESLLHTKLRNNPMGKYRTIRNQRINDPADIINENVILNKLRQESETELRRISELEMKRKQEEELFNKEKERNLKELTAIRQLIQNEIEKQKPSNSEKRDAFNYQENLNLVDRGQIEKEGSYSKLVHHIANSINNNEFKDLCFDRYSELKSSNVSNLQKSESSPVEVFLTETKFPELNLEKEIINEPNDVSIPIIKLESDKANNTKRRKRGIVEQIDENAHPNKENNVLNKINNKIEDNFDSLHNDLFDLQRYLGSKIVEKCSSNRLSPEKLDTSYIKYYNAS